MRLLIPVMPVDLAYKLCCKRLIFVGHVVILHRIHDYDQIQRCGFAHAHGSALALEKDPIRRDILRDHGPGFSFLHLKRTALEQIHRIFPVFRDIYGKFRIHRIGIFFLDTVQHAFHLFHQGAVGDKTLAGNKLYRSICSHFPKPRFRVMIMLQKNLIQIAGKLRRDLLQRQFFQGHGAHVDDFRLSL